MIRRYVSGDEADVIDVYLTATIPGQAFLPESFWRDSVAEIRDELMPRADIWVAEDDRSVVAFVAVLSDVIGGLFTRPDHQGRGHASALLERVRRADVPVFVEVFEANTAAIAFYRRRGFVEHERHDEAATGLPALVMRLDPVGFGQSRKQTP